jgi:hypothetical protein
MLFVDEEN